MPCQNHLDQHVSRACRTLVPKRPSHQGKDKGSASEAVVLEDAVVDAEGKPLPRVFVPRAAVTGDESEADGTETPDQVKKKQVPKNGFIHNTAQNLDLHFLCEEQASPARGCTFHQTGSTVYGTRCYIPPYHTHWIGF